MKALFRTLLAISPVLLASCAKEEKEPEPVAPAVNFKWTPTGGQTFQAEDAYYISSFNNIVATKSGGAEYVDINLTKLTTGTYSISVSSTGNTLVYSSGTATFTAKSGQVTISSVTDTKLSGSFDVSFSTGSGLSGDFKEIGPR
jgi:hypothetical protein